MSNPFFAPRLHPKLKRFVFVNSLLSVGLSFCAGGLAFCMAPPDAHAIISATLLSAFFVPAGTVRRYGKFTPLNSCLVGLGGMLGSIGIFISPLLAAVGLLMVTRAFSQELATKPPLG